jgi:hypothetical protein
LSFLLFCYPRSRFSFSNVFVKSTRTAHQLATKENSRAALCRFISSIFASHQLYFVCKSISVSAFLFALQVQHLFSSTLFTSSSVLQASNLASHTIATSSIGFTCLTTWGISRIVPLLFGLNIKSSTTHTPKPAYLIHTATFHSPSLSPATTTIIFY